VTVGQANRWVNEVFWSRRRVFVTGHTGFTGSWLVYWLQRMKAEVAGYALRHRRPQVCSGVLTSVRGVVAVVAIVCLIQSSAAPQFGALQDRSNERVRAADVERASSLLGWAPSMSLEQGLKATVDCYATRAEMA
jgi:nucleoside-diphosphate-sugar epimerase